MGSGLIPAEVIQYVDLVLGLCYQRNLVKPLAALPYQLCLGCQASFEPASSSLEREWH